MLNVVCDWNQITIFVGMRYHANYVKLFFTKGYAGADRGLMKFQNLRYEF